MQTYALTPARIDKYKGRILSHAIPMEVLSRAGRQEKMPKNSSKTYIARRWLPYGATTSNPNQFFQTSTATDRTNALIQAHQTSEGVTRAPESIVPQDVTVVMKQYSCLYGLTDQMNDLYEDDAPSAMKEQIGERVTLVNEQIIYGELKASTSQYYGGTGTTRATVNGPITLNMIRKMTRAMKSNHGVAVSTLLKPSANYGSDAVGAGYFVYGHTDLEADIRDLPNFTPVEKYASGSPLPNEIGKCESFRFILSPDLPSIQDAGAAIATWTGTGAAYSTTGASMDVYQFIVLAKDAFSQISIRGKESIDITFLPPNQKDKSDPLGQRGYAGAIWYKAAMLENSSWCAVGNCGVKSL
jgi:N4-gp56 family major capsid protein